MNDIFQLKLDLIDEKQRKNDYIISQRDYPNRTLMKQNIDINYFQESIKTKASTFGGLTEREEIDSLPVVLLEQTEQYMPEMLEENQYLSDMQKDLKWMIDDQKSRKNKQSNKSQQRDSTINWVTLVHTKYKFTSETLHRTVNIIDNFLSINNQKIEYKLLAITSFWMAAKVQETRVKELKVWTQLGQQFSIQRILQMQSKILEVLKYNILHPTSQMFLKQFLINYVQIDIKSQILCFYILELSLTQRIYTKFKQSIVAVSTIYLCFKVRRMNIQYLDHRLSGYISQNYEQIRQCSKILCRSLQNSSKNNQSAIFRKYSSRKYMNIASICFGKKQELD